MPTRARTAFTMLEVLLVMALLGVIAAVIWPDFAGTRQREQLHESANRLQAVVAMCRAQTMNEARRYRLAFRVDGSIRLTRQLHPVDAPHIYMPVRESWVQTAMLLESVWVESILPLPEGPPPILVEDELIDFDEFDDEPLPIESFDQDVLIEFEPDGTSGSLRWVLRTSDGRGVEMTLDGRLGRVTMETLPRLEEDDLVRPEALPDDEDEFEGVTEAELLEQYARDAP